MISSFDWSGPENETVKFIVYGVSMGEYSDYNICAIFDTREKAEKYIESINNIDKCPRCGGKLVKRNISGGTNKIGAPLSDECVITKCGFNAHNLRFEEPQIEEFDFNPKSYWGGE